jgi:glycosyltransferase involved in cell wall biosynthesis
MTTPSGQVVQAQVPPRISVIIPVFNGGPMLEQCLSAIDSASAPEFEVLLVDDGSTDGMTRPAALRHAARLIALEQQHGPAFARNCGASAARGEIIFFTDADVLLHADALSIALGQLDADPHLSAVFGSYDDQPGHASFLSQYRNLYHHWVHQNGNVEASTFWTGCGAIRREVFLEMHGFSVDYRRPSIEDIELGMRLRESGHRIRLEKTMLGKHMKHWTFWNMLRTDIFLRGVPWVELVLRHGRMSSDLNLSLGSRIATILAGLLALCLLVFPLAGYTAALWPAAALLILGLVATQWAFYRYLAEKRSSAFALAVVPMQVLFFLGCAIAVPLGFIRHHLGKRRSRARNT